MRLFVDDMRDPPDGTWTVARTYLEAVTILEGGSVEKLSLDHDLGVYEEANGCDIAQWMVDNTVEWPHTIIIHTANPLGREDIEAVLRQHAPKTTHIVHDYRYEDVDPEG